MGCRSGCCNLLRAHRPADQLGGLDSTHVVIWRRSCFHIVRVVTDVARPYLLFVYKLMIILGSLCLSFEACFATSNFL